MKKFLLVVFVGLILITTSVTAGEMRKGISVGAALGAPFTFEVVGDYNFGGASATVSLGFIQLLPKQGFFEIGLEGAYHLPFTLATENKSIVLYPTLGGRLDLQFGGTTIINIGGVIGLNYLLDSIPVRIFAKAIPHFQIGGMFRLAMKGEVGALYSF